MSNGLDFFLGDPDGRPIRQWVSMLGAFGSVAVAEQLDSGEYPLLRPLWGYLNTPIPADQIPALRSEIVRLVKALSRDHAPQEVLDELDDLLVFLRATEQLGLGIHVSGP